MERPSSGLPKCEGPQLHPFRRCGQQEPVIEFLEKVETGATAHVVKAKVDDQVFALKLFIPTEMETDWPGTTQDAEGHVDRDLLNYHMQPFFAECRAYGRLKELGKEDLAVRCHGWLELSASQLEDLETKLGPFDWDDEDEPKREPIRAIVKDFVEGKVTLRHSHARMALRKLKELHRCGILVADVKEDMYVEGVLVDFSHAKTLPHILFDPELGYDPYERGQREVWNDLAELDCVFNIWNERKENNPKIRIVAAPDLRSLSRLRNKKPGIEISNTRVFDPTKFDWRRYYQQKREAASVSDAKKPRGVSKTRRKNVQRPRRKTKME